MLEPKRIFIVPACAAEASGELSNQGVQQARQLGDAFGDIELKAAYCGSSQPSQETDMAIAARQGLALRRKPMLEIEGDEEAPSARSHVIHAFDTVAKVSPGRVTLVVTDLAAAAFIVEHCLGEPLGATDTLEEASITEITLTEGTYQVERLGDATHLSS